MTGSLRHTAQEGETLLEMIFGKMNAEIHTRERMAATRAKTIRRRPPIRRLLRRH